MTVPILADAAFDGAALARGLDAMVARLGLRDENTRAMRRATASVIALLDATPGLTLQDRWTTVEQERWPHWESGQDRLAPVKQWT